MQWDSKRAPAGHMQGSELAPGVSSKVQTLLQVFVGLLDA